MCENLTVFQRFIEVDVNFYCYSFVFVILSHTFANPFKKWDFNHLNYCEVNTLSFKTKSLRKEDVNRQWFIVDAEGEIVGRMGTKVAHMLRGKHKPDYTPHVDNGDYIIVINAEKARFTGDKLNQKEYVTYSGYPGGQKKRTAKEMFEKKPIAVIEHAVKGMLPKSKLGNKMFNKLFVYEGSEHPHKAQKPQAFKI